MIICVCTGKTEKDIRSAIKVECKTFRALQKKYNIGKECCACIAKVKQLLKEEAK